MCPGIQKKKKRTIDEIKQDLIRWKKAHNLFIHPAHTIDSFARLVEKRGGGCPCVPSRDFCPCEESLIEIKTQGWCGCHFFYSKEGLAKLKSVTGKY